MGTTTEFYDSKAWMIQSLYSADYYNTSQVVEIDYNYSCYTLSENNNRQVMKCINQLRARGRCILDD